MAATTACEHDWLPSRKRPTWDYCPKCGATRNRQMDDRERPASDAEGPSDASTRVDDVGTVAAGAASVDDAPASGDGSAPGHEQAAPGPAGAERVAARPPVADASAGWAFAPTAAGDADRPPAMAAGGALASSGGRAEGPSRSPWLAEPTPDTAAQPAVGAPPVDQPASAIESPHAAWTLAPRDVAPQEPLPIAPATSTPSPWVDPEASSFEESWPAADAPILASPSGVVAPSAWRSAGPPPSTAARVPTATQPVTPRITRPQPIGATVLATQATPEPADSRRPGVRTFFLYALLIALGVVVGFIVSELGQSPRAGGARSAVAAAAPSATSAAPVELVATASPVGIPQSSATIAPPSGPVMASPVVSLGDRLRAAGIELAVAWQKPEDGSDPAGYDLRAATDGGAFRPVSLARPKARKATFDAVEGRDYVLQLRARSRDGSVGAYAESAFHLSAIEDSASGVRTTAGWRVARHPAYVGTARYATKAGASMSIAFDGTGVAIIGPKGPGRGRADVIVDGERVARLDAWATTFRPVELLAAIDGLAAGPHVLTVKVAGTAGRPMVAVDRFLVLSQP